MKQFNCITLDPAVMGGKACIRGLRVTVGTVLGLLAAGRSRSEILASYPYLESDDLDQALAYAAWQAPGSICFQASPSFSNRPQAEQLIMDGFRSGDWQEIAPEAWNGKRRRLRSMDN